MHSCKICTFDVPGVRAFLHLCLTVTLSMARSWCRFAIHLETGMGVKQGNMNFFGICGHGSRNFGFQKKSARIQAKQFE